MFGHETITSFSEIKLRLTGMRITEVYEILCRGEEAEISLYWLSYKNGEDKYDLQKRVRVPADAVIDVLDQCGVLDWDGFNGANPPHVLDGTMFRFTGVVNDGKKLRANGSNNFPKHFRDFTGALYRMLNEA